MTRVELVECTYLYGVASDEVGVDVDAEVTLNRFAGETATATC